VFSAAALTRFHRRQPKLIRAVLHRRYVQLREEANDACT
jgi:hypothetical protein